MRFRHAISISIDNFSAVFKLLLYRLVTAVIFFSLGYVILRYGLADITESAEAGAIKSLCTGFLHAIFTGDTVTLQNFQGEFAAASAALLQLIAVNSGEIAGCIVGLALLYLVSRFVNGLAVFAIGGTLNDRMATYSRTTFAQSYFRDVGKAALYQIIYVPVCFVYDAAMLAACWFLFFYAPSFLPSWGFLTIVIAISLALTAVVCLEALKMTLISGWMPGIIADGKKVGRAFGESLAGKKGFLARYASFLSAVYVILIVNVVGAIATVGSALFITVPLSYIFLLSLQFVHYYHNGDKKYFVSLNRIVGKEEKPEDLEE